MKKDDILANHHPVDAPTPGPWEQKGLHVNLPNDGYIVAKGKNAAANARAVAAVPDLVQALELAAERLDDARRWFEHPGDRSHFSVAADAVRAALAKARGRHES